MHNFAKRLSKSILTFSLLILCSCAGFEGQNYQSPEANALSELVTELDGASLKLVSTGNELLSFHDVYNYKVIVSNHSATGFEGDGPFIVVTQPPIDCNSLSVECSIEGDALTCNQISSFISCPEVSYLDYVFRFDDQVRISKSGDNYQIENSDGSIGYFENINL